MPSKERPDNGSLPTNIEQATPEYIQQNLASWEEKILNSWISPNVTDTDKPVFLVEAEQQAAKEKVSLETILARYSTDLRNSTYPTQECLHSEELEHLPLHPKRHNHVETCAPCSMLLAAASRDTVPEFAHIFFPPKPQPTATAELEEPTLWAFAKRRGRAVFVPIAILLIAFSAAFALDPKSASLTAPSNLLTWVIVALTSFGYLVALRNLKHRELLRTYLTAAIVGVAISGVFFVDFHQSQKSSQEAANTTAKLAQSRTEMLASSALEQKQATGEFLTSREASAIVNESPDHTEMNVETEPNSAKSITYIVTIPKVPGKIKAEVQSDAASGLAEVVWLDVNNKVQNTISYLLARVKAAKPIDNTSAQITFEDGRSYVLRSGDKSLPPLGSLVVAKVNPIDIHSLNNLRVVSLQKSTPQNQQDQQMLLFQDPPIQRTPVPPLRP